MRISRGYKDLRFADLAWMESDDVQSYLQNLLQLHNAENFIHLQQITARELAEGIGCFYRAGINHSNVYWEGFPNSTPRSVSYLCEDSAPDTEVGHLAHLYARPNLHNFGFGGLVDWSEEDWAQSKNLHVIALEAAALGLSFCIACNVLSPYLSRDNLLKVLNGAYLQALPIELLDYIEANNLMEFVATQYSNRVTYSSQDPASVKNNMEFFPHTTFNNSITSVLHLLYNRDTI